MLNSIVSHTEKNIAIYISIAILCYYLALTWKQVHNAFYLLALLPGLILLNSKLIGQLAKSRIFVCLTALGLWSALSILWSPTPNSDNLKDVLYVLLFVIAVSASWQNGYKIPTWFPAVFASIVSIATLYWLSEWDGSRRFKANNAIFSSPLTGANSLCFITLFSLYFLIKSKSSAKKIIFLLASIINIYALFECQSRSSFAGFLAGLFVLLGSALLSRERWILLAVLFSISVISTGLYLNSKNYLPIPKKEFSYRIANTSGIDYIEVKCKKRSLEICGDIKLTSGNIASNTNRIPIDKDSRKVSIYFSAYTTNPYLYLKVYGVDNNGNKEPIAISPPRVLRIESTLGNRLDIWKGFFDTFLESPIWGHGISTEVSVKTNSRPTPFTDTHNSLLNTAVKTGTIGVILHMLLFILALHRLLSTNEHRELLLSIFSCGLVVNMFDDPSLFDSPLPYWLLLLFPIGYAVSRELHLSEKAVTKEITPFRLN
jgi:O-antigen ligase